ncbi:MAG: site-2 protease family protein [Actinomycetota bacterium]|nr:site-2 protease family protein [Actinomycetota bacterium]
MFGNAWRVGKVAGVEIKIDASWALIVFLIVYSLYALFSQQYPGLGGAATFFVALVVTALFFGSVLTHELAHAVTSLRRGIPVQGITLFLFGGATHAKLETREPKDEFVIAAVGPLTSLVLGGLFWAISRLGGGLVPEEISGPIGYLGWVNLALAVFNLVPGFPLDGGRLLRSAIWHFSGNLSQATRIASRAGQIFGYLLVGIGLFLIFNGALVDGLWLAAIGWFLTQAAWGSYQQLHLRRMLEAVDAEDVMFDAELVTIPSDISLRQAVEEFFLRHDHNAFPVQDGERVVGLLTLRAVRQVPSDQWDTRQVWHTMTSLDDTTTVSRHMRMDRVLERLQDENVSRVLVTQDGAVVGIITPRDVARWLRRSNELGMKRSDLTRGRL